MVRRQPRSTLFPYSTLIRSHKKGENGSSRNCTGKSAPPLIVKVPRGTIVRDAKTGRIMADMSTDEPKVIAKGGNGGKGNVHFATSTRQIPRFAKPGFPGEEFEVTLELKLLADVGLVGFPNVGKSTLFNKLIGKRLSIVENTPGVTRDRIYAKCEWRDRAFMIVDTGGIEPTTEDVILKQMREQAQLAIEQADGLNPVRRYDSL